MRRSLPVAAVLALGLLAGVTGIHLWAQWVGKDPVSSATQPLLMPLLALAVWLGTRAPRPRLVRLLLLALFLSWLGDTAPRFTDGDPAFLLMVGFFLLAQVAYVAAFLPCAGDSLWATMRPAVAAYVALVGVLVALCASGAGPMLAPILVYGVVLATMAVLATGLGRLVWIGAHVFLVSDAMIALGAFAESIEISRQGFWVMLTYVAAQVLITLGVLDREPTRGADVTGSRLSGS